MRPVGKAGGPLHNDLGRLGLRLELWPHPEIKIFRRPVLGWSLSKRREQHLVSGYDSGDIRPTAPINSVRASMTHGLEAAIVEYEADERVK